MKLRGSLYYTCAIESAPGCVQVAKATGTREVPTDEGAEGVRDAGVVVRMEGVTSTALTVITRGNTTRVREVVHTVLRATTIVDSTLINICQGRMEDY